MPGVAGVAQRSPVFRIFFQVPYALSLVFSHSSKNYRGGGYFFPLWNWDLGDFASALLWLRFGGGKYFAEQGEDFGDAEGLLQERGFTGRGSFRAGVGQVAGHVNHGGLRQAGSSYGFEQAGGGFAAVHEVAACGKMQVDEQNFVPTACSIFQRGRNCAGADLEISDPGVRRSARRAPAAGPIVFVQGVPVAFPEAPNEGKGFFGCGGTIHTEALTGEAFLQEQAQAFFVVEDEDAAALENFGGRRHRQSAWSRGTRGCGRRIRGNRCGEDRSKVGFRSRARNRSGRSWQ